jgi:CubicO group peptidase (beta-lactamase class C family)
MGLTEQRPIRSGLRATRKQSRLRKMGVRDEQNRVPTRCSCWFSPQSLDSLCPSHQTGLPNWRYQTKNVLQFQSQPGTQFGYSGEGSDYVARFAGKKTGRPFEELAQKYVFDRIG